MSTSAFLLNLCLPREGGSSAGDVGAGDGDAGQGVEAEYPQSKTFPVNAGSPNLRVSEDGAAPERLL